MDAWQLAGGVLAVLAGLFVWLSFVERLTSPFSRVLRVALTAAAGGFAYVMIGPGWPGRDARGAVLLFAAGLLAWRLGTFLGNRRLLRCTIVVAVAVGLFVFAMRGGPDDVDGWMAFVSVTVTGFWLTVIRALPRVPGSRGSKRPRPAAEERHPREFTSDDGARLVDLIGLAFGSTRSRPGAGADGEWWEMRRRQRANNALGSFVAGELLVAAEFQASNPPELFRTDCLRVLGRLSNTKGHAPGPKSPAVCRDDTARDVRGLTLRLARDAVPSLDIITLDIDRFVVRKREDFAFFMQASAASPWKQLPALIRLLIFGRTTFRALLAARGRKIDSYSRRTYHGIHTFYWQIDGRRVPVRYVLTAEPEPEWKVPDPDSPTDRLDRDLSVNLGNGREMRFRFDLVDGTGLQRRRLLDPVLPWGGKQPRRHVGMLVFRRYESDDDGALDALGFSPHNLTPGISPSDDEVLMARRAAYPESHARRLGALAERRRNRDRVHQ